MMNNRFLFYTEKPIKKYTLPIALVLLFLSHHLLCMNELIPNELQLLPFEIQNKIARLMVNDFFKEKHREFKKQILFTRPYENSAENNFGSIVFHPTEKIVSLTTSRDASLFDIESNALVHTFQKHDRPKPYRMAFSNDGEKIGIADHKTVCVYNGKNYNKVWEKNHDATIAAIAFFPYNNNCAIASHNGITFWDTEKDTVTLEKSLFSYPSFIAFSNTNNRMTYLSNNICTINEITIEDDGMLKSYTHNIIINTPDNQLRSLAAWTSKNQQIITMTTLMLTSENGAREWKRHRLCERSMVETRCKRKQCTESSFSTPYNALTVNPKGTEIALLLDNGDIHLWDMNTRLLTDIYIHGAKENLFPKLSQQRIAFSPCGKMLGIAFEENYELWHITNRSKEWLANNMGILVAALINQMHKAKIEGNPYLLKKDSKDYKIFMKTPDYVQDFLRHNYPIKIYPV